MIAQFRPLFFVFIFVSLGIYIGKLYKYDSRIYFYLFLSIFVAVLIILLVYLVFKLNLLKWFWINKVKWLTVFISVFVGFGLYYIEYQKISNDYVYLPDKEYHIVGIVDSSYVDRGDYLKVYLDDVTVTNSTNEIKIQDRFLIYIMVNNKNLNTRIYDIKPGDKLLLYGKINNIPIFGESCYNAFAYKNKYQHTFRADYKDVCIEKGSMNFTDNIRENIRDILHDTMSYQMANLAYSVFTGDGADLDKEIMIDFQRTGIAHIIAVSGMNIVFIAMILKLLFKPFKIKKKLQILITILVLIMYCAICGFAVPVTRATLMYILLMLGNVFGYQNDTLSSVSLAGLIILLVGPSILFDLSFLLSFVCVFSIIFLMPLFQKFYQKSNLKGFWDTVSMTIAAQIGTLPFLANTFGEISLISIIANVLIVPVFGIVYMVFFVCILLAILFPFIKIILWPIQWGLYATCWSSSMLASIPFAMITAPKFLDLSIFCYMTNMFIVSENCLLSNLQKIVIFSILSIMIILLLLVVMF